eukprot:gnl/MRDRNA2_/MRDRNA2_109732_c0_seq1.p1 gnl/MRDRNA2_/MRDRNA2_109732_c0~~gnl/MRDRNA2_/MRDRNA2_109732_c0_seq1.p1  ORF type:complete len:307 (+),score=49.92 gnl/MRDRNA2_/MRDRNA2_109732_c0_seq1:124-1044(+)
MNQQMETMCRIIVINHFAFIAQSHATQPRSAPIDRLDGKLFDRALSESFLHHAVLDDATLGKLGHDLAMPRTSLRSHLPPPDSRASDSARASFRPQFSSSHIKDMGARVAWPSTASHRRHPWSVVARAAEEPEPPRAHDSFEDPKPFEGNGMSAPRNVLGGELQCCCSDCHGSGIPTGFYRDGFCSTGRDDIGRHTVCIEATSEFLEFSKSVGNDMSTPNPEYLFPGVRPGDRWCLCLLRWVQAYQAGMAPRLYLESTHEKTLERVDLEMLMKYAVDAKEAKAEIQHLDDLRAMLERSFAKPSHSV